MTAGRFPGHTNEEPSRPVSATPPDVFQRMMSQRNMSAPGQSPHDVSRYLGVRSSSAVSQVVSATSAIKRTRMNVMRRNIWREMLTHEQFGGGEADAGRAAGDETGLAVAAGDTCLGCELISFHGIKPGARPQRAVKPPSTIRSCPVTNDAAGELSQSTAVATSSGVPTRPIGCCAAIYFFASSPPEPIARSNISV